MPESRLPRQVGSLRLLIVAGTYPYPAQSQTGGFNERCAQVLKETCEIVEVLTPRPYLPGFLATWNPRWEIYAQIPPREVRHGIRVHRPAYIEIPKLGGSAWTQRARFLSSRGIVRELHREAGFDAILAFDLVAAAGLAWRLGRSLGIPVAGWALGSDVRWDRHSRRGRAVAETLRRLDLVFYQSQELKQEAARLLDRPVAVLDSERHVVLSHGIPAPPHLDREQARAEARAAWGISSEELVVLYTGRILRSKGIFELLNAFSAAAADHPGLRLVLVGSVPGWDDTAMILTKFQATLGPASKVKVLPVCAPQEVWKLLCGADIFAFPSHKEGMPNSVLEAMAMGLPVAAFAIPPVREIEAGTGALRLVPPFDERGLCDAILGLAGSGLERKRLGEAGRKQVFERFMVGTNVVSAAGRLARLPGLEAAEGGRRP